MTPTLRYERKIRVGQVALLAALVAFLEVIGRAGVFDPLTYVPPSTMFGAAVNLVLSGELLNDITVTLGLVLASFLLAVAVGVPIGWLLWRHELLKQVLDPYMVVIYALPLFVFYPMFVVIFGLNKIPIVLIAFGMGVTIIVISTANGLGEVSETLINVGRSLELSQWEQVRYIIVPAAIPHIFTGLKLGFVYAFIGVIASEFIIASSGLGYMVAWYYENFLTKQMYGAIVLVIVLAVVINLGLIRIEKRLQGRM